MFHRADSFVLGALAALLLAGAPSAQAATVSGLVTSTASATPIAEICVQLQDPYQNPPPTLYQGDPTTVFGQYSIDGVTPGDYRVHFYHCPASGTQAWIEEYSFDKQGWQSADIVHVTEPGTTVDASLEPGHTISGRVTSSGSNGLQNVCVSAFNSSGSGQPWNGGRTDVNGNYTSPPIPFGTYKIRFSDCNDPPTRVPIWYSQKTSQQAADVVDLNSMNRTGIDATLAQTGYTISGHVTNGSGVALPNVCVNIADAYNQGQGPTAWGGQTDQNGDYRTEPVPNGQYKLQFSDCSGTATYQSEWWNDKNDWSSAGIVTVSGANLTGYGASLSTGYTISGTVTAGGGSGVQGICVNVLPAGSMGPQVTSTQTLAGGAYTVGPLSNGQYKLQFSDCRTVPQYRTQWYSGATDFNSATAIPVSNANVTDKNVTLLVGRTVSGTVTSDGSTPIQGICVSLAPISGGFMYGGRSTQSDGTYYTEPVPPGQYALQFQDCRQNPQYASEWFDNQYNPANSTVLDLSGGSLTGKNATLATGYTISGTVTDGTTGVQGICVQVFNTAWSYPGWNATQVQTQGGGSYTTTPLPPGSYKIQFNDCRPSPTFVSEWWDNATDYIGAGATTIIGSNITDRNAVLAVGHTISGTITTNGTTPVPNGVAAAFPASGPGPQQNQNPPYLAFADAGGHYRLGPLPSDNYKVEFAQWPSDRYFTEWWNNKSDFASGDSVDSATDPSNINAVLDTGYTISGKVTSNGTTGIQNVCVNVSDAGNTDQWVAGAQTDASGNYSVGPLRNGQYVVGFDDCNSPPHYVSEWWNNKTDPNNADPITIAGADQTGKDATLANGYTISGKVTSNGTSAIENVCIDVRSATNPDQGVAGGQTDSSGNFTTAPVPPGSYKLGFSDCNQTQHYVGEWWNDQPDWDHATPITVVNADLTGYNATLTYGHTITGTVTGAGAGALADVCVSVVSTTDQNNEVAWANTDQAGAYSTSALPPGTYKVRFEDCGQSPHWVSEWWNNQPDFDSAATIPISNSDVTGISPQLAAGYTISGHISETGTGTPLQNVCVDVTAATDEGRYFGGGDTDQNGDYRTEPLPAGDYKLSFGECDGPELHVREWWDNKTSFDAANVVSLTTSNATGINVALAPGHRISGQITAAGTGTPIPNVCIGLFTLTDPDNQVGWGWTDDQGNYDTTAVPYGHYKMQFNDCNQTTLWVSEWYDNKTDFATANDVNLTTTNATLNASLARGGGISGTIRSGTGGGPELAGICANAQRTDGPGEGWGGSDQTGSYRIGGLPSGHYDVHFWDCRDDQSNGIYPPRDVTNVLVTAPNDTSGLNVDMGSPDNTWPNTYIASGPIGTTDHTSAVFAFVADEQNVNFECKLDGAGWDGCQSPVTLAGLSNAAHTFQVRAIDQVGHTDASAATRTWTVNTAVQLSTHSTRGTVPPGGGSVTDDPLASGASQSYPIRTTLTSPATGDVEITEAPAPEVPVSGWTFFGYKVSLVAPVATASDPLQIAFTLDSSLIPAGAPLGAIGVFRDGAVLLQCNGVSMADPDPCIVTRERLADGDVRVTVLSSHASRWNFGKLDPPVNTGLPVITGTAQIGSTLTCSNGNWTGSPTLSQEWRRDTTVIGSGTTHLVAAADAGHDISCKVTATNDGGSASATSAAVHIPGPPAIAAAGYLGTIGAATAEVGGSINGGGSATTWYVEYGTTTDYGSRAPATNVDLGFTDLDYHQVSQTLSGLSSSTSYHFRLVATNGDGTVHGSDHLFTTKPAPPAVSAAVAVEDVTATSAEIGGTINPNGAPTTYHFDYGLTAAYGLRVPALDADVGSDKSGHYVGEVVTDLIAATTYHFRLVATNSAGTTYGSDHTFTTPAAPAPADHTPPDVAITCPAPVSVGAAAVARWTASDSSSGLATPSSGEVVIDTSSAGQHTALAPDARDNAGNVRSGVSCLFTVNAGQPLPALPGLKIVTKKVTATAKRDVTIKLTCSAAPCKGTLSLKTAVTIRGKKKTLKLGSKSFTLKAGTTGTVKIRLSKANFATLAKLKRLTSTVTATVTGGKTATARVVISAPKRR